MTFTPREFTFGPDYRNACLSRVDQEGEIMRQIHEWVNTPKNILFFGGNVGTGKTYFCAAIYNELRESGIPIRAFNEDHFVKELKAFMNNNWDPTIRIDEICDADVVIYDDMGCTKNSEWKEEMLFHFLDLRYSSSKPTIITSNMGHKQVSETYHARFASRLFAAKNTVIFSREDDRRAHLKYI